MGKTYKRRKRNTKNKKQMKSGKHNSKHTLRKMKRNRRVTKRRQRGGMVLNPMYKQERNGPGASAITGSIGYEIHDIVENAGNLVKQKNINIKSHLGTYTDFNKMTTPYIDNRDTVLIRAIKHGLLGNHGIVHKLLKHGVRVLLVQPKNDIKGVRLQDRVNKVKEILNAKNTCGNTALMMAIMGCIKFQYNASIYKRYNQVVDEILEILNKTKEEQTINAHIIDDIIDDIITHENNLGDTVFLKVVEKIDDSNQCIDLLKKLMSLVRYIIPKNKNRREQPVDSPLLQAINCNKPNVAIKIYNHMKNVIDAGAASAGAASAAAADTVDKTRLFTISDMFGGELNVLLLYNDTKLIDIIHFLIKYRLCDLTKKHATCGTAIEIAVKKKYSLDIMNGLLNTFISQGEVSLVDSFTKSKIPRSDEFKTFVEKVILVYDDDNGKLTEVKLAQDYTEECKEDEVKGDVCEDKIVPLELKSGGVEECKGHC